MTQKVLVKLGLDFPHASSLYYFLREFDKEGKGWVKLPLNFILNFFGIKRKAIVRRLNKGLANSFYYDYEITRKDLWVKYVSNYRLKTKIYPHNFASVKLAGDRLRNTNVYKQALYEAAIAKQQNACEKAIARKETSSKRIANPFKYVDSNYAYGCDYRKGNKLFFKSHINTIGASQIKLAEYLDKSRATLNKWCNKFPSLKIWKRKKCLSKKPAPDIYQIIKRRKNGIEYRVQYKRMPNYYFVNIESNPEAKHLYRTIYSSAMLFNLNLEREAQIEGDINLTLATKKNPGRKLSDKLDFWFKKEKLVELSIAFWKYLKGTVSSLLVFDSYSGYQIARAIEATVSLLTQQETDILMMMIARLKNNKNAYPPFLKYPG